jgi:hypothetical protein
MQQIMELTKQGKGVSWKIQKLFMSQWAKWIAIESVMYPAIMYPHVNTYSTDQEIKPIDFIVSQLCCATLGLNRKFLIAILHDPTLLREGLASHPQNRKTQRIG